MFRFDRSGICGYLKSLYIVIVLILVSGRLLADSNSSLVYSGRIVKPDGAALSSGVTAFQIKIYDSSSNCVLWSETQNIDMANSNGVFSISLGTGTRTDGGAHTFGQIFVNSGGLSSLSCATGNSYSPGVDDDRKLVVQFNDGSTSVALDGISIRSVPYALQASQVSGYGILNLARISGAGSSNTFTPLKHDFLFNLSAAGSASATPCASGEILKFNGTAWACAVDATGGGAAGNSSYSALGLVQFNTDASTSGITVASGIASVNSGTAANQIVKLDGTAKLPAVDGSALTNLNAGNFASGILAVARGGTNSGTALNNNRIMVSNAGAITEAAALTNGQILIGSTGAAPTAATITAGSGITVTNSAGGITIAATGGGTVTNVTGSGAISSSGGATPVISIADSDYGTKGAVSILTDASTSGLTVASGVLSVNSGTAANQVVKLTAAGKYPAVDGSLITNISASNFGSTVVPVANGGTNSSTALTNGKVMVSAGGAIVEGMASNTASSANTFVMRDGSGNISAALGTFAGVNVSAGSNLTLNGSTSGSVGVASPAAPTSYTLTLPTGAGTSGQVLSTNGSGITSWISALTSTTGFINGGNSFGANTTFGTNDNFDLDIKTNNTSKITVKSAGNVGIGTSSPSSSLQVNGSGIIVDSGTAATYGSGIKFLNTSNAHYSMGMRGSSFVIADTSAIGTSVWSGSPADRFVINNNGNVGIGTASPGTRLSVYDAGGSADPLVTQFSNVADGNGISVFLGKSSAIGGAAIFKSYPNIATTANARMSMGIYGDNIDSGVGLTILKGGNVGIGTSAPGFTLHTVGSARLQNVSGSPAYFDVMTTDANNPYLRFANGNVSRYVLGVDSSDSNKFKIGAADDFTSTRMTIDSSGNVGIGTTNPSANFDVSGNITITGGNNKIWALNSSTNFLRLYNTSNNGVDLSSNTIQAFSTAGSERMRIDSSGNVGLGTTSPNSILDINGDFSVRGMAAPSLSAAGAGKIYFDSTANKFKVSQNGGAYADLVGGGGGTISGTSGYLPKFTSSSTIGDSRLFQDSATGMGIGTATPNANLHIVGNGTEHATLFVNSNDNNYRAEIALGRYGQEGEMCLSNGTGGCADVANSGDLVVKGMAANLILSARNATGQILFSTGSADTTKMTLLNNGNFGIKNTAPASLLHVGAAAVASGTAVAKFQNADGTCTMTPASSGSGIACSSDERLKRNIASVDSEFALERLLNIQAVTYSFKSDAMERIHTGYLAQDLKKVAPEFVQENDDGFYQVYYDGLIPWITEAIKTLHGKLINLSEVSSRQADEIAQLKKQNKALFEYICSKDQQAELCRSLRSSF